MYYQFLEFVLNQLKTYNELTDDRIIPINEIVESVEDYKIRPAITYGNNTDWSNIRRDEDFILTLQLFSEPSKYYDLNDIAREIKRTIIKYCCSKVYNDCIFAVNNISLLSNFETDYSSISINLTVNVKEVF